MDPAAIAETTVEMYALIDAKLKARWQETLEPEIRVMMLDKAMSVYITNLIKEQKYGSTPKADAPKDDEHCYKCSKELTIGELAYLEGRTGKERICYRCSH